MVTLEMRPDFTSSRNCEYSIGAWVAWRLLNWLNTVIRTSPMTSQMTRFLSMLFKDLLLFFAAEADLASYADFSPRRTFPGTRRVRRPACVRPLCRIAVSIAAILRRTPRRRRLSARILRRSLRPFGKNRAQHRRVPRRAIDRRLVSPTGSATHRKEW